jgi:hypothetical protein
LNSKKKCCHHGNQNAMKIRQKLFKQRLNSAKKKNFCPRAAERPCSDHLSHLSAAEHRPRFS